MSEILKVDNSRLEYVLEYSVRLILAGKVVSFPTDTFYCLGADPFNLAAVSEVYRIKGRSSDRPMPLLVASLDQAADLTSNPPARKSSSGWTAPSTICSRSAIRPSPRKR